MAEQTNGASTEQNQELGFDPAALKAKYLVERDKRLRTDAKLRHSHREVSPEALARML